MKRIGLLLVGMALGVSPASGRAPRPSGPACFAPDVRARGAAETAWLGSNPHLPLATTTLPRVDEGARLDPPGELEACKRPGRWGARGRVYRVLDAWGQVRGKSTVRTRERYEVSGCDEIVMAGAQGAVGDALLVAADGAWRPRESYEVRPSGTMVSAFETFIAGLDARVVAPTMSPSQASDERAAYFRVGAKGCTPGDEVPQDLVGTYAFRTGHYAVLARFDGRAWRAVWMSSPLPRANIYGEIRRLAILDMDGDDVPEIVFHQSEETDFEDVVIGFDPSYQTWRERSRSAGGSTI